MLIVGAYAQTGAVQPIRNFDAEQYLGTWYEIASIPMWFQRNCAYGTKAVYGKSDSESQLTVDNSCMTMEGETERATGRARFAESPTTGALEVTFVELLGYWLWPLSGDYIIFDIDPEYRWVAVGHPDRDYGWILSRSKTLDVDTLRLIETRFKLAGYDSCQLLMSSQDEPAAKKDRKPLCEVTGLGQGMTLEL